MRPVMLCALSSLLCALIACGGGGETVATPTLTSVTPAEGPEAGGTALTLSGEALAPGATVTVGGISATDVVVTGADSIECRTPPGTPGAAVAVVVTTVDGTASLPAAFRYLPRPTLTTVLPSRGDPAGGTSVTLTGTGFDLGVLDVTVGDEPATDIVVSSDDSCTCTTPPTTLVATVDVQVTTPGGTATLASAFRYAYPAPTIGTVVPDTGFMPGGTPFTLTGTGFSTGHPGPSTVHLGGVPATGVVAVDDETLTGTSPAGSQGPVDVEIGNAHGTATRTDGFTYYRYPPEFRTPERQLDVGGDDDDDSGQHHMCCDGANVYVVWQDARNGAGDIYFNRSLDGGATWLEDDVRLDSDSAGDAESARPRICCYGQKVYVVWQDGRNHAWDIRLNRSADGGSHWLTNDIRLDTDALGSAASERPQICCDADQVYVAWQDFRSGAADIYFNRSVNAGADWLTSDVRLDTDTQGVSPSSRPRICCDGSNVYVVWFDARNGAYDIYFNRSADAGSTWAASDVRLDTDVKGIAESTHPRMCCDGERVYVVWEDTRRGATIDVQFNRSLNGGRNWLADDVRVNVQATGSNYSDNPRIACDGQNVYVVWSDTRDPGRSIYHNRSATSGDTWLAAEVSLTTHDQLEDHAVDPRVSCSGPTVVVVWQDDRNGASDAYYRCSRDGGSTWLTSDRRLDTGTAGVGSSTDVRVACDGARIYVTWQDEESGFFDIHAVTSQP